VAERTEQAFEMFPRLKQRENQVAGTLSGGEQQMLAMSRALMSDPKVLLMDEPSMGLAPILVDQIFDTISQLHERGTTILLVEQNARKALQVADQACHRDRQIVLAERAELAETRWSRRRTGIDRPEHGGGDGLGSRPGKVDPRPRSPIGTGRRRSHGRDGRAPVGGAPVAVTLGRPRRQPTAVLSRVTVA
jgi:energy-coupling factor transporter ATP-binding protein EcfA2